MKLTDSVKLNLTMTEFKVLNAIIMQHCHRQDPNQTMPDDLVSIQDKMVKALFERELAATIPEGPI